MKEYITEISENVYSVNLGVFLSTQGLIYEKFKFDGRGIDLIDKYLFQVIEEIQEVNAIEEDCYAKHEELIDVMMYLGSTYFTISNFNSYSRKIIVRRNNKMQIKNLMDDVFSSIINARRMYPERKWHKSYSDKDIIKDREIIFADIIVGLILKIMELLITNYDYETINEMINVKQSFIYSLEQQVEQLQGNLAIAYEELKRFRELYPLDKREAHQRAYAYMRDELELPHREVYDALEKVEKLIDRE
jgi:hypothetical protein